VSANKVDLKFLHEGKCIQSVFNGVFEAVDLTDYFRRIMEEVPAGAGYREEVDFRPVSNFSISYTDFAGFSSQAAQMYQSGRVSKTRFHVANELQYGMARLFSSSTGVDEVHFEIIRD
jgi:hypothetical protein